MQDPELEFHRYFGSEFLERHRKRLHGRARLITIDLDPTDDPTRGAQQLTFLNWHYDTYCYLPVVGFLTFNQEAEQYLVTAVLRPGNAPGSAGAVGLLRQAFPDAKIRVRLAVAVPSRSLPRTRDSTLGIAR